jgi:hypothetical protein
MSSHANVIDLGNGFSVHWPAQNIRILVEYITRQSPGLYAEFTVIDGDKTLCEGQRLNLNGDKTRVARKLHEYSPRLPLAEWTILVETTAVLVLRRYREGEPLHILNVDTPVEQLSYQLNPLVFAKKPTIIYGDGGVGKSTFALLCAMMVATGETIAGLSAIRGRSLFIDYEDSHDVHVRRMRAISACHPQLARAEVRYQAHTEPLWNIVPTLLRRVQSDHISFVVLDSLAPATCGDASAEAAARLFRALRQLNVSALLLAHIPKASEQQQEPSIYGSVFNKNFARSTWELRKEQEVGADESILGLFHKKSNLSRLHSPIGLRVSQNCASDTIRYEPCDLAETLELQRGLPIASRIRAFLERDGGLYTAREIADAIAAPLATVKSTLSRRNLDKWHAVGSGREAKWTCLNR